MKNKILLLTISFLYFYGLTAQVLYTESFENFTIGNVSTSSDGQTIGQGGWYTYSHWTYQNNTPYSYLFQIQNEAAKGKVITMAPHPYPYSISGTSIRRGIETEIDSRTVGNDVIKLEVDFYTGQQINSLNTFSHIYFGLGAEVEKLQDNYLNVLAGFVFKSDTREIKGTHYNQNAQIMEVELGDNNQSFTLPFNTWVRFVVYADYINSKIRYEIPSLGVAVEHDFFVNIPYPTNISNYSPEGFLAWTFYSDPTDNGLPTYKFDNIQVSAINSLSIQEVLSNQFNLYPNPANNMITITNEEHIIVKQIKIYDLAGKLISTPNFNDQADIQLNIENLASGTYLLHLQTNEGLAVKKMVKK